MENRLVDRKKFRDQLQDIPYAEYKALCSNYDHFLEEQLRLDMFFPVGNNGNILEEPVFTSTEYGTTLYAYETFLDDKNAYELAKEKVLFEGFDVQNMEQVMAAYTKVEDLLVIADEFSLSPAVIKKLYGT
ncbi:hypothetical protein ATB99_02725 [Elizabethkingia meningoseptica]|uniref:hypothetical protein n=1 Tax=Elizabethkingia meningoseptica TaxID=238 RepID=UPI000332CA7B|nr:hypothetical protein [Elizabethkingia meningoseptica]AQX05263.1 hypothetical protein BBD33_08395 [Elizabethkingia meningoseptica]AQX47307.1 hypothetical protein B5G46_08385 [Elizabethkingia meningoseptica]EOR31093.1 hypothetical protein L100_02477 [Elizabethkingia meningoseptica ATCC 13253 = NBRC 12535]KUY24429.1 hypothetical protein ATB99_02725 [Elizabethkingia meningoseptica]OPB76385.1 hypothetical protein BAY30_16120 [Elizabethkingia meningoseptica]